MNEFELSEEYILDEAYKTALCIAKKEYVRSKHMLINHLSTSFRTDIDSFNDKVEKSIEVLELIHTSENVKKLELSYIEAELSDVKKSLGEIRNIELMLFMVDKLISKKSNEREILSSYDNYENFPDQYVTKIVLDMIDNLDHEKVQNIISLAVKNAPIRMHKNRIINYLQEIIDVVLSNGAYNFTEDDLGLFKENLFSLVFPEYSNEKVEEFTDINNVVVEMFYTVTQIPEEELDLESLQKNHRVYITIVSYLQSVLEELNYLLVAYRSMILLEADFNHFEKHDLPSLKPVFTLDGEAEYEDIIELFEDYELYMDVFPTFMISSLLFIGSDSNIIHRHELLSEIYILSELYKTRSGELSGELLFKYKLLDDVLNSLNAENLFSKMTIVGNHVSREYKKKFTEELLDDITSEMKTDDNNERFYRVNYIHDYKVFSKYSDVNFFDEFYSYVDELSKADAIVLARKLTEIYVTYKLDKNNLKK